VAPEIEFGHKGGPDARFGADTELQLLSRDNSVNNCQTETGTVFLRRKERLVYAANVLPRYARSVILDMQADRPLGAIGGNAESNGTRVALKRLKSVDG